ncbi:beta-galactosidase [Cellulomonas fengjieae]|uniref:beta-galactosidase n=1 Tax=Cellulomonas fengjieae TaxID=2819978 RepID=UPI001AAF35A8|nr:beta-galactosidase [Cellulomonas fengjieae]MBO3101934.1 beta-galactosidase [Cellulomonas fengjieae]
MTRTPFVPDRFWFGGDYNPEQWPREVWAQDVELMQRAGVTTATIGVFSWALLEPEEGRYDLGWLDDVIEMLHAGGIGVVLATPTASPPPWFTAAHPDALPVLADGTRLWHGSRDTYCVCAPAYREASRSIAGVLAERYGSHPALQAWHIHNEYGTYCWCDHVAAAFRTWLQGRYGTLEALNEVWWTTFWSQHYESWDQVLPPRATQYLHNPTQAVDFRRFFSDEMLDALREQKEQIRAAGSSAPVTTNFMLPTWNHLEQWGWSAELDVPSVDHYLDTAGPDGEAHVAYAGDVTRGWADGGPWLLMEQSISSISVDGRVAFKDPARAVRNSLGYVARGSQSSLFFQWRASAAGSEAWHGAMVPHAGADSATFRAVCELGAVLDSIAEVVRPPADGRVTDSGIAIWWHADGWWALDNAGLPSDHLSYPDAVRSVHRAAWHAGLPVDFARPGADLASYRVLLVPSMFAMDDDAVRSAEAFVAAGGHLVVWPFTGIADENLHVVTGGYPGRLRDLVGLRVEHLAPLAPGETVTLDDGSTGSVWSELVQPDDAAVLRRYRGGDLDGRPAVTRVQRGAGTVTYVSTHLDLAATRALLEEIASGAGIAPVVADRPADVEVVRRRGADHDYLFVLNHSGAPARVAGPGLDLVGGDRTDNGVRVVPGGYLVVREDADATWDVTTTD